MTTSTQQQQQQPPRVAAAQRNAFTSSPPAPHHHTCGLTLSPVKHASMDILETIKHQCECAPVSMGEYIASPRVSAGAVEKQWLLHDRTAAATDDIEAAPTADELAHLEQHATATVVGSMFTLTNTILGSGTLAVPFALASSGWLLGNAVMLAIALITRYSVYLLLVASNRAGLRCAKTYESLGHFTMGAIGTQLAEFTFIFGGFGTLVSYFIFITDLFAAVAGVDAAHKWRVTVVCATCVILPLSLTRQIAKLRLASVLAILSITYVVAFVFVAATIVLSSDNSTVIPSNTDIQAVRFEPGSVYTVTLLIGAFACHNTALPVYDELRSRSTARMDRAVVGAIAIAFALYEVIGLAGYVQFGAMTQDNILLNFTPEYITAHPALRLPLLVGRTCMGLALLLTAPIAMWPFRSCILSVVLRIKNNGIQTPSSAATTREYVAVTVVAQALILVCSIFVPSVKIPLSIVGSVSGSLLIFVMPALFFMLLSPHALLSRAHAGPLLMLGTGVVVGVVGLSMTLFKIYREHIAPLA